MKQIIEKVLEAEAAAAARLKTAQEQAAAMTAKAEAASLDRVNQAKQQCRQQMQAVIKEATRSANQVRAEMEKQAEEQSRDILTKNPARVDKLVQTICEMVLGTSAGNDTESQPSDK